MSCMMSDPRLISCLAENLEFLLNHDYEATGMDIPGTLIRALPADSDYSIFWNADTIYDVLYRLNLAAYNGRYPDHNDFPDEVPDRPVGKKLLEYVDTVSTTGTRGYRYIVQRGHYELLSYLDFFVYQCEEDATRNDAVVCGLRDLSRSLAGWIARNSDGYGEMKWGGEWK